MFFPRIHFIRPLHQDNRTNDISTKKKKSYHIAEALLQHSCFRNVDTLGFGRLPQALQFLFGQDNILVLQPRQALVGPCQIEVHEQTAQEGNSLQGNASAQSRDVMGRIPIAVGIWRPDRGGVTNRVDEGVGRRTLRRGTRDGGGNPTVERAVHGEDEVHEEQTEVARTEGIGGHENDESHDGDGDWSDPEPEPFLVAVGQVVVKQGVEDHEHVGRSDQQE